MINAQCILSSLLAPLQPRHSTPYSSITLSLTLPCPKASPPLGTPSQSDLHSLLDRRPTHHLFHLPQEGKIKISPTKCSFITCILLIPFGILPGIIALCCCCQEPKCNNCSYKPEA
ncbi:uncharacterized protein LOC143036937 isoform X4 [Oratosquilla oratoria]|uniref:uncharacterized protein LOC143036937 isoform X4 n=1 Tax=Oratosquilla oratoria TaxID=337810 RepID=UPI003F763504